MLALAACWALLPAGASAATRWTLKGAGWGHGIGMSQYGTYGYARHGATYGQILRHYYTGTALAARGNRTVRVLLEPNRSSISFRGAVSASGRRLDPGSIYKATRSGSTVVLRSAHGRALARVSTVLAVTGGPRVRLFGTGQNGVRDGIYRGTLELRTARGPGLNAINALDLESYVRGVVPNESPSSWPAAALQSQAVAARTYALATNVGGNGFDQYADTRSQMYRGYLSETPTASAATDATRGQVVTYGGRVVVTYFFSTSGGQTENVENVYTGSAPEPWLRGVDDPYDNSSPYHRWGPYTYSTQTLDSRLGSMVKGRLKGIDVLQRGVSPRVVRAAVRGTKGDTRVTGPDLRAQLGLRDTWFSLRSVSSTTTSGLRARGTGGLHELAMIRGSVSGASGPYVQLQRRVGGRWVSEVDVPLERHGDTASYAARVTFPGRYRVLAGWASGPAVTVGR